MRVCPPAPYVVAADTAAGKQGREALKPQEEAGCRLPSSTPEPADTLQAWQHVNLTASNFLLVVRKTPRDSDFYVLTRKCACARGCKESQHPGQ